MKSVERMRKKVSNLAQTRVNPRLYGGDTAPPAQPKLIDPLDNLDALKAIVPNSESPRLKDTKKVIDGEWRNKNGTFKKGIQSPHQFRKGEPSANPGGRPKGRSMTAIMNKMLSKGIDRGDGEMVEFMQILVERGIAEAAKGNFKYWKEILDRLDGKVTQKHEVQLAIKAIDAEAWDAV